MMVEDSEKWDISVCGLNCAKCGIYQAYHGNEEALNRIINGFRTKRNMTIRPEAITCDGCRGSLDVHWSPNCKFLPCAREKGHQYCFECDDFPCEKLEEFASDGYAHHRRTVENMKRMREIGIDAWIAEQKRKGQYVFCP